MEVVIIILVIGMVAAGVALILLAFRASKNSDTTSRINDFVTYQSRTSTITREKIEVQPHFREQFFERTFVAGVNKIITYLGRFTPAQSIAETDRKLAIIHNPRNFRAREFFAIRLLAIIVGIGLAILVNFQNLGFFRKAGLEETLSGNPQNANLLILAGFMIILSAFLLPSVWLNGQVRKTHRDIERQFPDALDLLSVCADAGLGFDQAMQRVGEYMENSIGSEFRRVSSEMEVGVSRADALRNMSHRLDVSEVSSFVTIIIQSESLGMRIADVLHSQAEQFRILRQLKAKEMANRLPAKMIIPLALLILPALLIVLLGPLIPKIFGLFA